MESRFPVKKENQNPIETYIFSKPVMKTGITAKIAKAGKAVCLLLLMLGCLAGSAQTPVVGIPGGNGAGVTSINGATGSFSFTGATCTTSGGTTTCTTSGASYPGVTTGGTGVLNVPQLGPASTASSAVVTPNNVSASIQNLNAPFLRQTHNQWALASMQQTGLVGSTQYTIGTTFSITAWSCSATTQLCAFTTSAAPNGIGYGLPVLITGLTTGTLFNNQVGTVVINPTPTTTSFSVQFPFTVTTASATEAGTATIQAVHLRVMHLLDSTALFHSAEQTCSMGLAFPGVGYSRNFAGTFISGVNNNGGLPCPSGGAAPIALTTACFTDGVTACASNGGTPLPADYTHFPLGYGIKVFPGGNISSNGFATSTRQLIAFETDPSSGTYLVETNNNGAGWVAGLDGGPTPHSGSATGAVGTGIVWSEVMPVNPYGIRITAGTGPLYVYGFGQSNTIKNGIVAQYEAVAGQDLAEYATFPQSILNTWHQALQPNLLFYEAKLNGNYNPIGDCSMANRLAPTTYIPFPTLWNNLLNDFVAVPTLSLMDIVSIGSYDIGAPCVAFQNDTMRASLAAMTDGSGHLAQRVYYDGFYQTTYAEAQGSQLNQAQTGNVHFGPNQQLSVGDDLAHAIGYPSWPTSTLTRNLSNKISVTDDHCIRDTQGTQNCELETLNTGASSVATTKMEQLWVLSSSAGTGIICFSAGSGFSGCPTGAHNVGLNTITFFGTGTAASHWNWSGSFEIQTFDTAISSQQFGKKINIHDSGQYALYGWQFNGVDQWWVTNFAGTGWNVVDRVNSKTPITIPLNTPTGSYGGNTTGPLLGGLAMFGTTYTAAGTAIPACAAGTKGAVAQVGDATVSTPGSAYTSGGTFTIHVQCTFNSTGSVFAWQIM